MTPPAVVQTDFDLHGLVGIRLLDAAPREVAVITRQLGPIQRPLDDEPDITIRFVDRLETNGRLRLLGIADAGFTDDAFLVLRGKHKSLVKVQIPFADIGQRRCDIVVERGLSAVPLLIAIINVVMLGKDVVPLHASAFEYNGTGTLVTGWSKGGKSETLLAFASNGARYIGDEWVYLSRDGQTMAGIPEPIRLWKWHFAEMPALLATVPRRERLRLALLDVVAQSLQRIADSGIGRRTAPGKLARRAAPVLKRQLNVQIPPEHLFGASARPVVGTPQKLLFVASHESPAVTIKEADPETIARRMIFSLQEERANLLSTYMKFRFAFPDARNALIEGAEERQRELLLAALAGKEAWEIYHPYPVSIPALYDVIRPVFERN